MEGLAASTINVRLSAVRRLVAEARHAGMLDAEEAAKPTDVPNIRERGTRLGKWLTKEQARELLTVPDRQTVAWVATGVNLCPLSGASMT